MSSLTPFWANDIRWLGRRTYRAVLQEMRAHRDAILDGQASSTLWLVEHEPVITIGRHGTRDDIGVPPELLKDRGIDIEEVHRGGLVTYHGPGQLVVYPIGKIGAVETFLEAFSEKFIELLESFGVRDSIWRSSPTGLWVGDQKIAACGLHLRKGVSMHGFALNVRPMEGWSMITPCGLKDMRPVSMRELSTQNFDVVDVALRFKKNLESFFASVTKDTLR